MEQLVNLLQILDSRVAAPPPLLPSSRPAPAPSKILQTRWQQKTIKAKTSLIWKPSPRSQAPAPLTCIVCRASITQARAALFEMNKRQDSTLFFWLWAECLFGSNDNTRGDSKCVFFVVFVWLGPRWVPNITWNQDDFLVVFFSCFFHPQKDHFQILLEPNWDWMFLRWYQTCYFWVNKVRRHEY